MTLKEDGLELAPKTTRLCTALLILLAGTARAGIIAPHFFLGAHNLLHGLRVSGASHARLFKLAAFAAHKRFLQFVGGGRDHAWTSSVAVTATMLRWDA